MKTVSLLPVILVFLASCTTSRYMYSPPAQNVPVLIKKGDSKISINYSTDLSGTPFAATSSGTYSYKNTNHGLDIGGAVAITNHIAIQSNYFNRTERDNRYMNNPDSTGISYKRNLTEIGVGYFKSMHRKDKVWFQVFGGVGTGTFSFIDKGNDQNNIFSIKHHRANIFKFYVQPAFIFRKSDNFALSLSSRLSFIGFHNIKTDYTETELAKYGLNNLPNESQIFWEPAYTNTFGFKNLPGVKFEYQFQLALILTVANVFDYHPFNFSLGVLLDIPKIFHPVQANNKNE